MEIKGIKEFEIIIDLYRSLKKELPEPLTRPELEQLAGYVGKRPNYATQVIDKLIEKGILYPNGQKRLNMNAESTKYVVNMNKFEHFLYYETLIFKKVYMAIRDSMEEMTSKRWENKSKEPYIEEDLKNMDNFIY